MWPFKEKKKLEAREQLRLMPDGAVMSFLPGIYFQNYKDFKNITAIIDAYKWKELKWERTVFRKPDESTVPDERLDDSLEGMSKVLFTSLLHHHILACKQNNVPFEDRYSQKAKELTLANIKLLLEKGEIKAAFWNNWFDFIEVPDLDKIELPYILPVTQALLGTTESIVNQIAERWNVKDEMKMIKFEAHECIFTSVSNNWPQVYITKEILETW